MVPLTRISLVRWYFFADGTATLTWNRADLRCPKGSFSTMSRILMTDHCSAETMSTDGTTLKAIDHELSCWRTMSTRSSWLESLFATLSINGDCCVWCSLLSDRNHADCCSVWWVCRLFRYCVNDQMIMYDPTIFFFFICCRMFWMFNTVWYWSCNKRNCFQLR